MDLTNTIFVSDFDGTLLTTDKRLTQGNIDAINEYQHLGGKFCVATGRPIQTVGTYIDQVHYDLPMILCNGAMIYDPYENKIIWAKYLPDTAKNIVREIYDRFQTVAPEVYTVGGQHYLRMNDTERWHQSLLGFEFIKCESVDDINEPICKLLFADEDAVIDELCEYVKKFNSLGLRFVRSLSKFLEVLPADVSKGSAVEVLKDLYGLKSCKVFTAGDYDNDIEMLKASDISFCPRDSQECVLKTADVVLKSTCDEDAIKEAIDYLISQ